MEWIAQILFALVLGGAAWFFARSIGQIRRNIGLGRPSARLKTGTAAQRWKTMARVALGQSKMGGRPVAAFFHLLIYVGFLVINIEVIEIVVDGLTGGHRLLGQALYSVGAAGVYNTITVGAELFMGLVLLSCIVFLLRRHVAKVGRFKGPEMTRWPKLDADIILWTEIVLVLALYVMNAADQALQATADPHYPRVGVFPLSAPLAQAFLGTPTGTLVVVERVAWWLHILGILAFLNYIPYSKHLHIMLAFPNTWYSNLNAKGYFENDQAILKEVRALMDDSAADDGGDEAPPRFGAKDVQDLTWVNLMNAYTCTECGRCTSVCPANMTGKKLSPRKIMMDTRDRLQEVGQAIRTKGQWEDDGKSLLGDYITAEELWACTSCNACVQACPVNIDPLHIILQMRQYLVLEEAAAPEQLNAMLSNVENNQAPWAFPAADRFKWADALAQDSNGNANGNGSSNGNA